MHSFTKWEIDNKYFESEDYKLNNNIASIISEKGYSEISKKYSHIKPDDIENVLKLSNQVFKALSGNGIDLGGGVGSVSSVVAKSALVQSIICLEITENAVKKCHPVVIKEVLGDKVNKVKSVIGDFDNLQLEDNKLDFAISWDSIHHSNNVIKTLSELNRVLVPGGYFILVDRAHNNATDDKEINRMLNIQYSKEFLEANYLPVEKVLTRAENGEHEYRYSEWNQFFKDSKFSVIQSLIIVENNKLHKVKNDAGLDEIFVDYELGGFERQKVIYLLKSMK